MNLVPTGNHLVQMLRDPFTTAFGKDLFYSNTRTRVRREKHPQLREAEFNRLDARIRRMRRNNW